MLAVQNSYHAQPHTRTLNPNRVQTKFR